MSDRSMSHALLIAVISLVAIDVSAQTTPAPVTAQTLSLTVLSTMLTDTKGIGEWGFAAVVEVDGRRWLFDTGARPDTVLRNAEALGVDLASITDVILSHHHADHTGGLVTLRKSLAAKNEAALSRVHVAAGMFRSRRDGGDAEGNPMVATRAAFEATAGASSSTMDRWNCSPASGSPARCRGRFRNAIGAARRRSPVPTACRRTRCPRTRRCSCARRGD